MVATIQRLSLPRLTWQSIFLRKKMDARINPRIKSGDADDGSTFSEAQ